MNFDSSIIFVAIEDIIPNRFQPRLVFEDDSLSELANSIKQHGIIQPLVLRRIGEKYEIIAGERRYKASILAGLDSVPAVIAKIDDKTSAEVAVVENVQRRELNAIEEAKSYKALLDQGFMSEAMLAEKLGLPLESLINKIKLLTLTNEVQDAILYNKISERHGKSLLLLNNPIEQNNWLNRIINERLTVRQLNLLLQNISKGEDMNHTINIEEIKQNATDINVNYPTSYQAPQESQSAFTMGPIDLGTKQTNKFFNSLESEEVNMQMTEAVNPLSQGMTFSQPIVNSVSPIVNNDVPDTLETLDFVPTMQSVPTKDNSVAKSQIAAVVNELKNQNYNIEMTEEKLGDSLTIIITLK